MPLATRGGRRTASPATSEVLRLQLELASPGLDALCRRFWCHPRVVDVFPEYLRSLYWSMHAGVPLMEAAAARCRQLGTSDPTAAGLESYLRRHAREERGHDAWLRDDMATLGLDVDRVLAAPPPPDVAAMVGTQHFWVLHAHPVALLGFFAVLEGSPLRDQDVEDLATRTGLARAGLRTLDKHAALDPHHRDELDEVLDGLTLGTAARELVALSALTVVEQLAVIMARLVREADAAALLPGPRTPRRPIRPAAAVANRRRRASDRVARAAGRMVDQRS